MTDDAQTVLDHQVLTSFLLFFFLVFFFLNPIRLFMSDSHCRTNSMFMYSLFIVCLLAVQQIASQRILNVS